MSVFVRFACALLFCFGVLAASVPSMAADLAVTSIAPIFGQLLRLQLPSGFRPAFEDTKGNFYIREHVKAGETVDHWSEMITVTGAMSLAHNPSITPEFFAQDMAQRYAQACPKTFTGNALGQATFNGFPAFRVFLGCGSVTENGDSHSEVALMIFIKGKEDVYTIQWAERSKPVEGAPVFDKDLWLTRYMQLQPIVLCPIIPGEAAPYPSCTGK